MGLERVLMKAKVSDDSKPGVCKNSPVVVQWDPERFISPGTRQEKQALTTEVQHMRSVQIGLKGRDIAHETLLNPRFVLNITDVTEVFRAAHTALTATPPDVGAACALLWSNEQEEHMSVPPELRDVLHMSPGDF